jgi:hypothetical protein
VGGRTTGPEPASVSALSSSRLAEVMAEICALSSISRSRSEPAFSKSCPRTAESFSFNSACPIHPHHVPCVSAMCSCELPLLSAHTNQPVLREAGPCGLRQPCGQRNAVRRAPHSRELP